MMGIVMPKTCWAVSVWQSNKFYNWLLHLVGCFIWVNQDFSIGNVKYSDYAATALIFVHNSGQLLYYYDMTHEQLFNCFLHTYGIKHKARMVRSNWTTLDLFSTV
jgi:hypothetical protein